MADWVRVCPRDAIEPEDVIRFDHAGRTFAVYRAEDGTPHATDGLCTHEQVHLSDGLVMGDQIECPKHNGRFDIRTGAPLRAPVCVALATWPARVVDGHVEIEV
jgi:3-phenylpropionate/trans-cinnamate dioxygenase ferredoxin subunit